MALADTTNAIGAVTEMLQLRLQALSGSTLVTIGKPEDSDDATPHLNLFLYQIEFDPFLKNTPLNEGEKPPLWMVLKYLLTAYSAQDVSDTIIAHQRLGGAIKALNRNDLIDIGVNTAISKALSPNPQELHVTFDESNSDLLAKLMQGTDEKYRLSICFQVRPVMIAAAEPGDYSLLVGIDYTQPPTTLADPYVGIDTIPSMGAHIDGLDPVGFEVGEEVTIRGTDLHVANLSVMLGTVELPVTMQRPDQLKFTVDAARIGAGGISAGSHAVTVVQTLPGTGKKRKSNAVIGNLVPTLQSVVAVPPGAVTVNSGPPRTAFATIDLTGLLLGTHGDDVIAAFYRNGSVARMFDVFTIPPGPPPPQTQRRLTMAGSDAIPAGDYHLVVIVNGQQAPQSPVIHMDSP